LSNPKFRFFLRKVKSEPLFIIFLGFDFDGCLRSCLLFCAGIFCLRRFGDESSIGFRLTQNLGFS
jgi:hypothetical protein